MMKEGKDCLVVGGGIVGAAIARALSRHRPVTLFEAAAAPGTETTATSWAWINANFKTPNFYKGKNGMVADGQDSFDNHCYHRFEHSRNE